MAAVVQQVLAAGGKREVLIDRTLGTNIGDMSGGGGLAAAFDGNTSQSKPACALSAAGGGYLGKTLAAPSVFGRAVVHGSTAAGFMTSALATTLEIYGKNGSAPGSRADGTLLGTLSFTSASDESAGRTVTSSGSVTAWDHLWVNLVATSGINTGCIAELVLYELK